VRGATDAAQIRINYEHQLIMQKRCLPCLDAYIDKVNLLLWPRLKAVADAHIASLRNGNARRSVRPSRVTVCPPQCPSAYGGQAQPLGGRGNIYLCTRVRKQPASTTKQLGGEICGAQSVERRRACALRGAAVHGVHRVHAHA
jgi:hypothetical protein